MAQADRDSQRLPRGLVAAVLLLTAAPLFVLALGLPEPRSPGSERSWQMLHELLEWSSVCVSLFTAALGFLYLGVRRDLLVSMITAAALVSGIWDAVCAAADAGLFELASGPAELIPWFWAAERALKALVLTSGTAYIVLRGRKSSRIGAGWLPALGVLLLPIALVFRPLAPSTTLLLALGLFALDGLLLYPLLVRRYSSILSRALFLSAAPDGLATLLMAFGSSALYDGNFFGAHALKLVASIVPLGGICLYLVRSYRREISSAESMERLVSELKSVEDELRSKEVRLNQLTSSIKEVFWISDPQVTEMFYVSPAYEEIFGLPCQGPYRDVRSFLDMMHPEDRQSMLDLLGRGLEEEFELDYRIIRPDGQLRWLRTRGFPIRNENGAVYRLAGITEDVTGRKHAEEALRASEARTRALLRAMPDLIFRMNRQGVFLDYHAQPTSSLYKPASVFLGAGVQDVLPGLGRQFVSQIEEALETGTVTTFEYRLECRGSMGDFEARFAPSTEDEVLVVVRDVTEQKRLQRELLDISNREQERIGRDLHDGIAQQLTGIALLCKALQKQLRLAGRPEVDRASQIEELVEDTLSQTRSLARGLAPVGMDAGGLPAALQYLAHGTEKIHGVRCHCRCDRNVDVASRVQAVHLYRIAQEAVTNALRHAEPSRISIELSRSNGRQRLAIQDDGKGISDGDRADGMGLHIMRYRARVIDGTLRVRPAPGGGTIVSCEWSRPPDTPERESRATLQTERRTTPT